MCRIIATFFKKVHKLTKTDLNQSKKRSQKGKSGTNGFSGALFCSSSAWHLNRPRPCQHQCPIVLVHEPKRMHELVHGHDQTSVEAGGVQVHCLVPPYHPKLAFALRAWIDGHIVGALSFGRDKGHAGEQAGEVVHGLPRPVLQLCRKYSCAIK